MPDPTIETLVGPPVRIIFEKLNLPELAHLRLVSKRFKSDVDFLYDGFKLKAVNVIVNATDVSLKFFGARNVLRRHYSERDNGEHFLSNFTDFFKRVILFTRVNPIKFDYLCHSGGETSGNHVFALNRLAEAVTESGVLLRAKSLDVTVSQEEDVIRLLNLMDPETIKELSIFRIAAQPMTIRALTQQPNWQRLRKLSSCWSFFNADNSSLLNFTFASILVDEMTLERMKGFLKTFLATEATERRFYCIDYQQFASIDEMTTEFGPYEMDTQVWIIRSGSQKSRNIIKLTRHSTRQEYELRVVPIGNATKNELTDKYFALDDSE